MWLVKEKMQSSQKHRAEPQEGYAGLVSEPTLLGQAQPSRLVDITAMQMSQGVLTKASLDQSPASLEKKSWLFPLRADVKCMDWPGGAQSQA